MARCCCKADLDEIKRLLLQTKQADVGLQPLRVDVARLFSLQQELRQLIKENTFGRDQQRQLDAIVNGLIGIRSLILEDREIEEAAGLEKDIYRLLQAVRGEMATAARQRDLLQAIQWLGRDVKQWLQLLFLEIGKLVLRSQSFTIAAIAAAMAVQFAGIAKALATQGMLLLRAIQGIEMSIKAWITLQHGLTQRIILAALKGLEAALRALSSAAKCRFEKAPPQKDCRWREQKITTEKVVVKTEQVKVVQEKVNVRTEQVKVTNQQVKVVQETVDLGSVVRKLDAIASSLPKAVDRAITVPGTFNQCGVDQQVNVKMLSVSGSTIDSGVDSLLSLLRKIYRGKACSSAPYIPQFRFLSEGINKSSKLSFEGEKPIGCLVYLLMPERGRQARLNMNVPLNFPNAAWYSWVYGEAMGVEERLEYEQNYVVPPPGARPTGIYVSVFPGVVASVSLSYWGEAESPSPSEIDVISRPLGSSSLP